MPDLPLYSSVTSGDREPPLLEPLPTRNDRPNPPGPVVLVFPAGHSLRRMAGSAAFFDLDRTLLKGASGPVISAALREAGVIPDRKIPGESAVYKIFDLFGENLASMALTRQ